MEKAVKIFDNRWTFDDILKEYLAEKTGIKLLAIEKSMNLERVVLAQWVLSQQKCLEIWS